MSSKDESWVSANTQTPPGANRITTLNLTPLDASHAKRGKQITTFEISRNTESANYLLLKIPF